LKPAIFLDRDGTLIEDRGHLKSPSEVVFFPDTVGALRALEDRFLLFIVTNQSGVGHGLLGTHDVAEVNAHVVAHLSEAGVEIADIYVCPHSPEEGCECIKPKPYFLHRAAKDHGADLSRSFSIGDHPHDAELACSVGGRGIYVLTGHGRKHRDRLPEGYIVVEGIAEAIEWIITQTKDW
jgi:D-glycero-D-manno-heptose 1,7-bisphosphate phosphatase